MVQEEEIACSTAWFDSCLESRGTFKKRERGHVVYTMQNYSKVDDLLGCNWHYRGINAEGDFSFVVLSVVEFHLFQRRRIVEYLPFKMESERTCGHLPIHLLSTSFAVTIPVLTFEIDPTYLLININSCSSIWISANMHMGLFSMTLHNLFSMITNVCDADVCK